MVSFNSSILFKTYFSHKNACNNAYITVVDMSCQVLLAQTDSLMYQNGKVVSIVAIFILENEIDHKSYENLSEE